MSASWISICYLIFGIASVSGNAVGGWVSDKIGTSKAIILIVSAFAIVLFSVPYTIIALPLFLVFTVLWGALSWALTPPLQNYLIQASSIIRYSAKLKYSCPANWYFYRISSWWRNVCPVMHLASFGTILVLCALGLPSYQLT